MNGNYPAERASLRADGRFWLVTLVTVAAVAGTAALGRWQLARAAQKQALQAQMDARAAEPPVGARELAAAAADSAGASGLVHRRVELQGQWLPEHTVFLDNRQMHGRPGFYVLTPLRLQGVAGAPVVLVQRGWAPRDWQERTRLPEVPTPCAQVRLQGRVAGEPGRLYELGPDRAPEAGGGIRQNLQIAAFAAQTGLPLLPLTVLQTGAASEGLERAWPAVDNGVDKHYGYAFQWFGLCALVSILYVWFQIVRRVRRRQP